MYELEGQQFSLQQLQDHASQNNIDFDSYMETMNNAGMINLSKQENTRESTVIEPINNSAFGVFMSTLDKIVPGSPAAFDGLVRFTKGFVDIADSTVDLAKFGTVMSTPEGLPNYIAKRAVAAQKGMSYEDFEKTESNTIGLTALSRVLDKAIIKPPIDKETGKPLDYIDLFQRGEYDKVPGAFLQEVAGAAASMIISRIPGGYALLGGTSFVDKLNRDLVERPDQDPGDIILNSIVYGGSDAIGEYFGGRYLNRLAGIAKTGGKAGLNRAKDVMIGGIGAFIKTAFKGGSSEFMQEAITSVIQSKSDEIIYGDEISNAQHFRQALHAGLIGFALGSGSGTVSMRMNKNNRTKFYEYLAPKSYKNDQAGLFYKLEEAQQDLDNAPADKKEMFQRRLDKIKKKQKDLREQLYNRFEIMRENDPKTLELMIDKIQEQHNALDIITSGRNYSESAKKQAKKDFKEAADIIGDLFAVTDINYDSDVELKLSKYFKVAEDIDKQNKNLWFKAKDLNFDYVDNQEKFDELKKQYGKDIMNSAEGFFEVEEGGKRKIFINRDVAAMQGATNVIGHEILHYAMSHRFANDPKFLRESVIAFNKYLDQVNPYIKKSIEKRLANPKNGYAKLDADGKVQRDKDGLIIMNNDSWIEEYFTMFSDLIKDEKIDVVEEASTGIKNNFRTMIRGLGLGFDKVDFKNGKEVFDLLIDYNKNIGRTGLLGKITQKKAVETVAGKKIEKAEAGLFMSKDASDNVQRIYEEKSRNFEQKIIEQFKPIVSRIAEKRRGAPNFDKELLMSEIEIGERGILDLIKDYKPDSGVPLAAYINKFLPARAIEASRRVLGEEFTQDVTEAKTVEAKEETVEVETKPKPKKIVLVDRLNVKSKVNESIKKQLPKLDIKNLTFKKIKNLVPEIVGDMFGISPKKLKTLANITKKELQAAQMFINKNADLLIAMLPEGSTVSGTSTGVPNTLLKAFYTKTDRAKMAKTGTRAGLAIQVKNKINKKEFLEVFGIIDGKPQRDDRNTSARVLALANLTGKMISNQAIRQQLETTGLSKDVLQNIKDGKSVVMFSKTNKKLATDINVEYNDVNTDIGASRYTDWVATTKIFKPGFLNKTIAITSSTIPNRDLRKYYKQELNDAVTFVKNKKYARTKINTKLVNESADAKLQQLNKRNVDNFTEMWLDIYDGTQSKEGKKELPFIINWLAGSVNEGTHPHRLGAALEYVDRTVKGRLYFEHALQNVNAYVLLLEATQTQSRAEFIKTLKALKKNYKLIAISAKDNKKIDLAGFKNVMSLDGSWDIFNNNWWERYFNEYIANIGGINPENLIKLGSNISLAKELGVSIYGKIPSLNNNVKHVNTVSKAIENGRTLKFSKTSKGITILDFDDTLATTESLVKYTAPDGTTGTLNAEQYASTYEDLLDQGFTFDFSDFNRVVKGKLAPLFNKALKLQSKFGPKNMFVLTARPPAAQKPIFDFLKANGLNIPLKNITGLGNSTSEAKALWIADKVGEGYNDFYFADDALQNVQAVDNMLEQFDVKRKVQQAKLKFSKNLDGEFNSIIEDVKGIQKEKRYSQAKARKRGEGKGRFRFFVPPSHEDFVGLLYNFIGKGDQGNKHRDFFEKALIKPLNRAYNELNVAKQSIANDYRALIKAFPDIRKKLTKKTPDGDFYYSDAIRVYLWNKAGFDIPGMSKTDIQELVDLVTSEGELQAFADNIGLISKQEQGYVEPSEEWQAGDIRTDLQDATGRVGRKKFFAEFIENADIIFSQENLNKIEAAYGVDFKEALKDILHRTKTGTNRTVGPNKLVNRFLDYINGSIGATMFFNARSAVLQTISTVNFINFGDNNIFAASRAFANQKQFWSDFAMLFNSDMLKQRRAGVAFDINANEIASVVSKSKQPVRAAIKYLLQIGFLPTQLADSFAISLGGASMYRNRVKTYLKQGLEQKEAETKAFNDFQEISESTQQSARPDKISQQQASPLGRMILAFQNTPSQYVRLMKKAALDLVNRRKTPPYDNQAKSDMSNISKIVYYGAIQNIIFYGLQSAMFAMLFEDDEKDEEFFEKKRDRILNGSLDTILRGMGVGGAVISTIKNTAIKYAENQNKGWGKEDNIIMMEMLQLSPPIGIKARKLSSAQKTMDYNKKVIEEMDTFDIDNPVYSAIGNLIEATTNIPLARLHRKTMNLREAANAENEWWQRLSMALGWSRWDVGVENKEVEAVKKEIKERNKRGKFKTKFKTTF
jgi:hypothetical protein